MGAAWLNLGSLVFGLISWFLPLVSLKYCGRQDYKNWGTFSILSISACAISLYMQIAYTHFQVNAGDWAGIEDTFFAVAGAATVLIFVTLLFNMLTMLIIRNKWLKG